MLVLGLVLGFGVVQPSAQMSLQTVMREKLVNTQRLLGDVVRAEYDAIDKNAALLGQISATEIASWQARSNPDYIRNAQLFLDSVRGIRSAAQRKDIAAVQQKYMDLISSCIRCHAYVRDARSASAPLPPLQVQQSVKGREKARS
jgi:hypothetical protein